MQAVAADPFEPEALHRLGTLYLREGRPAEGRKLLAAFARLQPVREQIEHYRYLLTLYPEDVDSYYNLGVLYGGLGHREAAANEYRRALAINPADLGARNNLANILLNTGQVGAAIQQYEQLLAQYPALCPRLQ